MKKFKWDSAKELISQLVIGIFLLLSVAITHGVYEYPDWLFFLLFMLGVCIWMGYLFIREKAFNRMLDEEYEPGDERKWPYREPPERLHK